MPAPLYLAPEERDLQRIVDIIRQLTTQFAGGTREVLAANRSYFVNGSSGSNNFNGLSSATPFATIQKAVDVAASLDTSIFNVFVAVAAGTYAESVTLKTVVGSGIVVFTGDLTTPGNVVIDSSGLGLPTIFANGNLTFYNFAGFKLKASSVANTIHGSLNGLVRYQNIEFDVAGVHVFVDYNAQAIATGNTKILASANAHFYASTGGVIQDTSHIITLSGSPAFGASGGSFAHAIQGGKIIANGNSFPGTAATGRQFYTDTTGVIYAGVGGAQNYFPGDLNSGVAVPPGVYT